MGSFSLESLPTPSRTINFSSLNGQRTQAGQTTVPSPISVNLFPSSSLHDKESTETIAEKVNDMQQNFTSTAAGTINSNSREDDMHPLNIRKCRDAILDLAQPVAALCGAIRTNDAEPVEPMADLFVGLLNLARVSGLDLRNSIYHKIRLNRQKYPVELCKGKAGKYTEYSSATGITRSEGQSLVDTLGRSITYGGNDNNDTTGNSMTLTNIQDWWHETVDMVAEFRDERNWIQYHTPRNLCLAITGEFGELAEILQFHGDDATRIQLKHYDNLMKEMADVAIYSISLANIFDAQKNSDDNNQSSSSSFVARLLGRILEQLQKEDFC